LIQMLSRAVLRALSRDWENAHNWVHYLLFVSTTVVPTVVQLLYQMFCYIVY
jgi:hypothetical protein